MEIPPNGPRLFIPSREDWLDASPVDNTSDICGACWQDPNQPLWWLVLQWLKHVFYKAARSYHAKPVMLILAPLVVGVYLGYWWGRLKGARQENKQQRSFGVRGILGPFVDLMSGLGDWISGYPTHPAQPGQTSEALLKPSKQSNSATQPCMAETSCSDRNLAQNEDQLRIYWKSDADSHRESGVDLSKVPQHIAVIMDGNRRYGKAKYGSASKGHWDGSSRLVDFAKWCLAEHVQVLTVYAFSTENWNRDPSEVRSLMSIFAKYCDELRVEALKRNIRVYVLSTDVVRVRQWSILV